MKMPSSAITLSRTLLQRAGTGLFIGTLFCTHLACDERKRAPEAGSSEAMDPGFESLKQGADRLVLHLGLGLPARLTKESGKWVQAAPSGCALEDDLVDQILLAFAPGSPLAEQRPIARRGRVELEAFSGDKRLGSVQLPADLSTRLVGDKSHPVSAEMKTVLSRARQAGLCKGEGKPTPRTAFEGPDIDAPVGKWLSRISASYTNREDRAICPELEHAHQVGSEAKFISCKDDNDTAFGALKQCSFLVRLDAFVQTDKGKNYLQFDEKNALAMSNGRLLLENAALSFRGLKALGDSEQRPACSSIPLQRAALDLPKESSVKEGSRVSVELAAVLIRGPVSLCEDPTRKRVASGRVVAWRVVDGDKVVTEWSQLSNFKRVGFCEEAEEFLGN